MSMMQMLLGAGGAAPVIPVSDLFSTDIYTGNNTQGRVITNNINLTDEGGMVWIKSRSETGQNWVCVDTVRGASKYLTINDNSQEQTGTNRQPADGFTTTGFKVGNDTSVNGSSPKTYASWTFRKAAKFFDIQTFTTTASLTAYDHDLGTTPGFIITKSLSSGLSLIHI